MKKLIVVVAMLYLIGMSTASAAPYNDGRGRVWLQVGDTYSASWADVAAVCPQDGQTACDGSVPGKLAPRDLTDWIWATDAQVRTLFSYYTPDILTNDSLSGSAYLQSARSVFNGFNPLNAAVCAGGCPAGYYHYWLTGWTSTLSATTDLPVYGYVEADNSTTQNGVFTIASRADGQSSTTGVFLWRPTGQGTGRVYANFDTGSVGDLAGGTAIPSVLTNDWNNGGIVTFLNVTLSKVSSTSPGLTLDPYGALLVDSTVGAGTHDLVYQICSTMNTYCDTATARVTVPNIIPIRANYDSATVSSAGGVAVANVLANDLYNFGPATTTNITLTLQSTSPGLSLNVATGEVTAASGIAAGSYYLSYKICDKVNTTNCAYSTVTVAVVDSNLVIQANADAGTVTTAGGVAIASVLANDLYGTAAATYGNVTLQTVQAPAGITLNTPYGWVIVAAGTAAGSYAVDYRICDKVNTVNCSTARATVTVTDPNVVIQANADTGTVTTSGGVAIANVLANDLYGTVAATTANVSLQTVQAQVGVTLDPLTGAVSVAAGTATGSFVLSYRICDKLNAANCASAGTTVTVRANVIDAVNDSGSVKRSTGGVAIANVLANDTLEGAAATTAKVTLSAVGSIPRGFTFKTATGAISVASQTSTGTYTLNYRICEKATPTNCDQASAIVRVVR